MKGNTVTLYALGALMVSSTAAMAQETAADSVMNRVLLLEKEYNPTVRDADKINKLPAVEAPKTNKTEIVYSDLSVSATPVAEINPLASGDVQNGYVFSRKRGYLNLGYGNYNNLKGDLGFRFVDTDRNIFGIEYAHASTSGQIKVPATDAKTKLNMNDNYANLYYRYLGSNLTFNTNLFLDNRHNNFYGYCFPEELNEFVTLQKKPKQTLQRFGLNLGMESKTDAEWQFKGAFGMSSLKEKYNGLRETKLNVLFGLSTVLSDSYWRFATDLSVDAYLHDAPENLPDWSNTGVFRIAPAFRYDNEDGLKATLGINADIAFGKGPHFGIAPQIALDWEFSEGYFLYADMKGGVTPFSLNELTRDNRFFVPYNQYKNRYTPADFTLGLRSNKVGGFWFDLYAGGAYTKHEAIFYNRINRVVVSEYDEESNQRNDLYATNYMDAYTDNVFAWKIGGRIKYSAGKVFNESLQLQKNGWNMKKVEDID